MSKDEVRATYVTTERAGTRVAGIPVQKAGQELELTAAQAEYELGEGTIVKKGADLDAAFTMPSEGTTGLLQAAADFKARKPAETAPTAPEDGTAAAKTGTAPTGKKTS